MSTNEIATKAREYKELTQFIKQLQDEADALKAAITGTMEAQGTDTLTLDLYTVKWTSCTTQRIDTTAFKKENPDLAERYTKTAEAKRFSVA